MNSATGIIFFVLSVGLICWLSNKLIERKIMDEFDQRLSKVLRNRLKTRENKEYLEHVHTIPKYYGLHADHILKSVIGSTGKLNDLLLAMCLASEHEDKHYGNGRDFTDDLIQSLENIFDYVEHLQKELKERK